jgi:hypothetical protein
MSPISAAMVNPQHRSDPRHGPQQRHVGMVGAGRAQRRRAAVDLLVEAVDQPQRGRDITGPRLGQRQAGQQPPAGGAEQVRHRAGMAEGQQGGVDPVRQRGAVTHQVQPPAGPLPLGAHRRVRQPDRRYQIAAGQLGQHPGVDPIGLGRQRGQPRDQAPRRRSPPASRAAPVGRARSGRRSSTRSPPSPAGRTHRPGRPARPTRRCPAPRWSPAPAHPSRS